MQTWDLSDYRGIALEFAKLLAERQYREAYALTSQAYRQWNTAEQLQAAFESIVPLAWSVIGPIEVVQSRTTWPGQQSSDLGWVYVSIGGDVYSEGVTLVVTSEQGVAKIRDVELGRP